MKKTGYLFALVACLATGCAMNGGHSTVKTFSSTAALDADGHAILDKKGRPVMNETNFYARVAMKQAAVAAASAIKDFTYARTNSPLGDAKVSLAGSTQDAKVDPELVSAVADSVTSRLVPGLPLKDEPGPSN
jgi:hypothetical protein